MYTNAFRYRMIRQILTGSEQMQAKAQAAVATVMRGETRLTPDLVDAAIDAALESFGVRTKED